MSFSMVILVAGKIVPLYKGDVDPTAKCLVFVRQVVAVESQPVEDELVEPSIEGIDLALEEDELDD